MRPLTTTAYAQGRTPLLRITEVAEELGVSTRTVRRAVRAGAIEPVRIGRAVRFAAEDVDALIARSKNSETPAGQPGLRENSIANAGGNREQD